MTRCTASQPWIRTTPRLRPQLTTTCALPPAGLITLYIHNIDRDRYSRCRRSSCNESIRK
ncbi:hypothetical protein RSAG8_10642, partial [Rhizoctonia solani AG-8 WAC10335]